MSEEALQQSVDKWTDVAKTGKWLTYTCPLCVAHFLPDGHCRNCPIFHHTNQEQCFGTPYYDAQSFRHHPALLRAVAQLEVDFLRSLQ